MAEEAKDEPEAVPEDIQKLRERIRQEKERSEKLDEQIKSVQEQILAEKTKMNGITPQEKHAKLVKEVRLILTSVILIPSCYRSNNMSTSKW